MIKRMLVATFFLFAVLLFMLPRTDDIAKKKMSSAAMLMCSNDFRKAMGEYLLSEKEQLPQFTNTCPDLIAALEVDDEGVITLQGARPEVRMWLTPEVEFGELRWACRGEPAESITALCKP